MAERELGVDLDGDGDVGEGSQVANPLAVLGASEHGTTVDRAEEGKPREKGRFMLNEQYHRDLRQLRFEGWGKLVRTVLRYLMWVFSLLFVSFLGAPLHSACVARVEGQWPSDHWVFYAFALVSVVVMYLPMPMFSFVLTGDYFDHGSRKKQQTEKVVATSIAITVVPTIITVAFAAWQAKVWGFPMYFTQITAGFPGLFLCCCICAVLMKSDYTNTSDGHDTAVKVFQLFAMFGVIMFSTVGFPWLGIRIHKVEDPWLKGLWSLGFPLLKFVNTKVVKLVFKGEVDKVVPFSLWISVNNAVFPATILPSAIGFGTLVVVALLDVVGHLWTLRELWIPILKVCVREQQLEDERAKDVEAIENAKRELEATKEAENAHETVQRKRKQRMLDRMHSMRDLSNLGAAELEAEIEAMEEAERLQNEEELRLGKDLDGDGDIGEMGHTPEERQLHREAELAKVRLEVEKEWDERALKEVRRELRATSAARVRLENATDTLLVQRNRVSTNAHAWTVWLYYSLWKLELMRTEQNIVLFTIQEFVEVIVPFFILLIECWLRFGWNSEAIPQISHQPLLDTDIDDDGDFETTGFIWSSLAKLMLGSLNALTFLFAGSIVNNCSDMEFEAAFVWVLRHYHEVLVAGSAGILTFCYTAMMPHYNFNLRILVEENWSVSNHL